MHIIQFAGILHVILLDKFYCIINFEYRTLSGTGPRSKEIMVRYLIKQKNWSFKTTGHVLKKINQSNQLIAWGKNLEFFFSRKNAIKNATLYNILFPNKMLQMFVRSSVVEIFHTSAQVHHVSTCPKLRHERYLIQQFSCFPDEQVKYFVIKHVIKWCSASRCQWLFFSH